MKIYPLSSSNFLYSSKKTKKKSLVVIKEEEKMFNENETLFAPYTNKTTKTFTFEGVKTIAKVLNVIDGDTLTVVLPITLSNAPTTFYKYNLRLFGIDTSEIHSMEEKNKDLALKAKYRVLELITKKDKKLQEILGITRNQIKEIFDTKNYFVHVECLDFDKYGRLLAKVFLNKDDKNDLSTILIQEKLAYSYDGKTKLTEEEQREILS